MHFISIKVHKQVKRKPRFSGFPEVCGEVEYPLSNCKTNGSENMFGRIPILFTKNISLFY